MPGMPGAEEEGTMKRHITGPEVAAMLGVKPNTVRAWRTRGKGPPFYQPAGPGSQATYDPDMVKLWAKFNPVRGKILEEEENGD